jgi:hypothetical protein
MWIGIRVGLYRPKLVQHRHSHTTLSPRLWVNAGVEDLLIEPVYPSGVGVLGWPAAWRVHSFQGCPRVSKCGAGFVGRPLCCSKKEVDTLAAPSPRIPQ